MDSAMNELYKMFSESIKSDNIKSSSVHEFYRLYSESEEEKNDYFIIGNYIGDGSMLLCDRAGKFYKSDHCYGIEEDSLLNFLDYWYNNN